MNVQIESCHKRINILSIPSRKARELYFYPEWVGHFICKSDFYINRCELDNYLLIYTCRGEGELLYDGRVYSLTQGSVAFLNCSRHHEYYPKNDGWEFKYVHFRGANTAALFESISEVSPIHYADGEVEGLFDRIREMVSSLRSEQKLSELIYRILMRLSTKNSEEDWLKSTVSYISEFYGTHITVGTLAKRAHLSRTYFSSEFKRQIGACARSYIENFRIENAKRLLDTTNESVLSIAIECGYPDTPSFIRSFKRVTKTTPLKYRDRK